MRVIKIPAELDEPLVELEVPGKYPAINKTLFGNGSLVEEVKARGLQTLYYDTHSVVLLVDEDGLSKWLPFNQRASILYGTHVHRHPIVGDAYIVAATTEDWVDLPARIGTGQVQAAINMALQDLEQFK